MSTYLVIVLVALVVTFILTIAMSSTIIASTDVLFFIVVACCIILLTNPTSKEEFVNALTDFPNTIKKVGTKTDDEVLSITQQTWNESILNEMVFGDVTQYYTTFSNRSISSLGTVLGTWIDLLDSKNKISFNKVDWAGGLAKGLNLGGGIKGMGPASMSLGIPYVIIQEFTIFYICRYNSNPTTGSAIKVLQTYANTQSNNGVLMEFDAASDSNMNVFLVTPRIRIADTSLILEPFYANTQNLYMHTVTFIRQNGNYVAKYSVTTIDEKTALMNEYKNTLSLTDPVFFSNRSIQVGDDTIKTSPISLYVLGFAKRAFSSKEVLELGKYFQGINLKLSTLAMSLYSLYGEVTMCPYDKATCDACVNVNLANPNNVLLAKADCKIALDKYCSAHPDDIGCECYKKENQAEPYCGYWKKMLQGAPTLCTIGEQAAANSLLAGSASTDTVAKSTTTSVSNQSPAVSCPQTQTPPKPKGFWEVMGNILGYGTNGIPIQPPKQPACPSVSSEAKPVPATVPSTTTPLTTAPSTPPTTAPSTPPTTTSASASKQSPPVSYNQTQTPPKPKGFWEVMGSILGY